MSSSTASAGRLSVIILTLNEEKNLPYALDSVQGWADEVFVLDSYSTDRTVEIARRYGAHVSQNKFVDYAKQRNHALKYLPILSEWVLFLDADEWLPNDLKQEIRTLINAGPQENGFYIRWRLIWMGSWIRRGYYPSWILRLFRYGKGHCEDRSVNEHLIVDGLTGRLRNDFVHEDRKGVSSWIEKHNSYATREAVEQLKKVTAEREITVKFWGTQAERKRWMRYRLWNNLPLLVRPILYFIYRYFFRGGFMDGKAAFSYHFLQGLWFPMLIDIKYLEIKRGLASRKS